MKIKRKKDAYERKRVDVLVVEEHGVRILFHCLLILSVENNKTEYFRVVRKFAENDFVKCDRLFAKVFQRQEVQPL